MTRRLQKRRRWFTVAIIPAALVAASSALAKPPRLQPTRIYGIGDSITQAYDSNFLFLNLPESWVNGFHGSSEASQGFVDVNSHNQRLANAFGVEINVMGASAGVGMGEMAGQALAASTVQPNYVTVMLGGNDICRNSPADVPTSLAFALDYIDGVAGLDPGIFGVAGGLPPGSTVYTAAVPDVKQLYEVGMSQSGLFGLDCTTLWDFDLFGLTFPCGSMLSSSRTEAERLQLQSLNSEYNVFLAALSEALDAISENVYWQFTWTVWTHPVQANEISGIDCFHPSSQGQAVLSEITWADGPFSAF